MREREEAMRRERAKEEIYDRMVNPHLYGKGEGDESAVGEWEHINFV